MISMVIGMGEVGRAVYEVTESNAELDASNPDTTVVPPAEPDVMHICFPYSTDFVAQAQDYMEQFKPKHVVVWSTVPIGTCRKIDERVAHSPVEGKHPYLADSIRKMKRWMGFNKGSEGRFLVEYFLQIGISVRMVGNTETTELLKLRSTAKYGINLVWAQYEGDLCKKYGVNYSDLMQFDADYNDLYRGLGQHDTQRYVLYPPDGEIGGHCVVQNAKLLQKQFPSDLLEKIIAMESQDA